MKGESDIQWFSLSAVLEYYDFFGTLVIIDSNRGGNAKSVVIQADLTRRN